MKWILYRYFDNGRQEKTEIGIVSHRRAVVAQSDVCRLVNDPVYGQRNAPHLAVSMYTTEELTRSINLAFIWFSCMLTIAAAAAATYQLNEMISVFILMLGVWNRSRQLARLPLRKQSACSRWCSIVS
jgi:hypothetical protein